MDDNNEQQDIPPPLKKSLAARLTAVGFIVLIFSGNIWFVLEIMGTIPSIYLVLTMQAGLVMVVCGGIGLMIGKLRGAMKSTEKKP